MTGSDSSKRSRYWQDLHANTLEGRIWTTLCQMTNFSYRTGRKFILNLHSDLFDQLDSDVVGATDENDLSAIHYKWTCPDMGTNLLNVC